MFLEATGAELFYGTVVIGALIITIGLEIGLWFVKKILRKILGIQIKKA